LGVTASRLSGATASRPSSAGLAFGKGGDDACRWCAPDRVTWFSQVKKEEGASSAWTEAAAHNKQGSDNAAARNILNFTGVPLPEQATMAVAKELTKIGAVLRPAVREPAATALQDLFTMQANEHTTPGMELALKRWTSASRVCSGPAIGQGCGRSRDISSAKRQPLSSRDALSAS
jgi:hypothetical protein